MTTPTGVAAAYAALPSFTLRTRADNGDPLLEIDASGLTPEAVARTLAGLDFDPDLPDDEVTDWLCEDCLELPGHGPHGDQCSRCAGVAPAEPGVSTAPAAPEQLRVEMPPSPFVDVAAVLAGNVQAPAPSIGRRSDGAALFYPAAVNVVVGDPESGKSLLAVAAAAEVLQEGGAVLWLDLDHNGAPSILVRLRAFGVPVEVLTDKSRFALAIVEDREQLGEILTVATRPGGAPTLAVMDSIGELVGLYGGDQNSDGEYTAINRQTLARLAAAGACVIAIDHLAKASDSRAYGASGSVAKKRAIDGVMLRVDLVRPFIPGEGGRARLLLVKDRHGGVRGTSPTGGKNPLAATFEIRAGTPLSWRLWAPERAGEDEGDPTHQDAAPAADIATLATMTPTPTSKRDVMNRTGWGSGRALRALTAWRSSF